MVDIDPIINRIQKFYESEASVETDVEKTRISIESFKRIRKMLKQYLNYDLINKGQNGPLSFINSLYDLPYPSSLTTKNMILIKGKDVLEDPNATLNIVLCYGPSIQGSNLTGIFTRVGMMRMPTIFIYVIPPNIDYSFGEVARKQFVEYVAANRALLDSYTHELRHYTDWMEALQKNVKAEPLKGYKNYEPSDRAQKKSSNTTRNYATYINQVSEVNARYAEWLVSIVYSLGSLPEVKEHGMLGVFPRFQDFWDYMWANYAPDGFINHATPKVEKYLKRRLYKFYDYACDLQKPPDKKKARELVQAYLKKDQSNATST